MAMFKAIKPTALKGDTLRLELLNEMRSVGREVKRDFEGTVANWQPENKPTFDMAISLAGGGPTLLVEASGNSEIYGYVSQGTRPHIIRPVNAKVLRFSSGYKAKTSPGSLISGPGGYSGDVVFTDEVQHPGNAPRKFEEQIYLKYGSIFKRRMEAAMKRAAAKSGHAI